MEHPPTTPRNATGERELHTPDIPPRRNSFTPSLHHERSRLRSSPLAGPSFSTDDVGNIVQHAGVLEVEIARRRSLLPPINDERLVSPPTPSLSHSGSTNAYPSHTGSIDDPSPSSRVRPSLISFSLPASPSTSTCDPFTFTCDPSMLSPDPPRQALRPRHSSPHISVATGSPHPKPVPANWMTVTPAPSFPRLSVRSSEVVFPVKASSRAGKRIRRKSTSGVRLAKPAPVITSPKTYSTMPSRSLRSFCSMNRPFLSKGDDNHHGKATPVLTMTLGSRFRTTSTAPKASDEQIKVHRFVKPAPLGPIIPFTSDDPSVSGPSSSICSSPGAMSSRFSGDSDTSPAVMIDEVKKGEGKEGRVKRLWTKVLAGVMRH